MVAAARVTVRLKIKAKSVHAKRSITACGTAGPSLWGLGALQHLPPTRSMHIECPVARGWAWGGLP